MSETKTITSPADYARLRREAEKAEGEIVTLPKSGANVLLRRASMPALTAIGAVPQSLVETGMKAWIGQGKAPTPEEVKRRVSEVNSVEEVNDRFIFMRQMVVEHCLEPRIGLQGTEVWLVAEDGSFVCRLNEDDFMFMFEWITGQRGYEGDGLDNFREGREGATAPAGLNRKGRRAAGKHVPRNKVPAPGV